MLDRTSSQLEIKKNNLSFSVWLDDNLTQFCLNLIEF